MKIVKGNTVDAQIRSIDRVLSSLAYRSGRLVIGALPPIPVFNYVEFPEDGGVVLRRIMPGPGKISKGVLYVQEFLGRPSITIDVMVEGDLGGAHSCFQTNQKMNITPMDLSVTAGTRLTVSVSPADVVRGVWTSFLYEVSFDGMVKQQYLLDNLLMLMEGEHAKEVRKEIEAAG